MESETLDDNTKQVKSTVVRNDSVNKKDIGAEIECDLKKISNQDLKKSEHIFATFVGDKFRWLQNFTTFSSDKPTWLQLFATFGSDKSRWMHLFATFASNKSR